MSDPQRAAVPAQHGIGETSRSSLNASGAQELEFRRRWYEAHAARFEADRDRVEVEQATQRRFAASAAEALALRDGLGRTGDVEAFRAGLQDWALKPNTIAFRGPGGQGFVNHLVKRSDDASVLARVLADALTPPSDDADAGRKVQLLVDHVETIKVGAYPAPGHSPFLLSYFWALHDHGRWPVFWPNSVSFLEYVTGEQLPDVPAERYGHYLIRTRELEPDNARFWSVASWWNDLRPVFLDPVLLERCAFGLDPEAAGVETLASNADALVTIASYIGRELVDDLSAAVGRTLSARKPPRKWMDDQPRSDLWVDWKTKEDWHLGVRLWINHNGAAIGVRPGWVREGWYDEAAAVINSATLPGFRMLSGYQSKYGDDVDFMGGGVGEFIYARWYEPSELAHLELREEATSVAAAAQPLIDELTLLATGEEPPDEDDPLAPLVDEFRARGYPTPADEEHRADRERFAEILAADAIAFADMADLRRIWNISRYGSPGPQAVLNTSLRDANAAEYDRIIEAITYLCWDEEDEDADRIDALLDTDGPYYVKGLGESVMVKLLAICHPERFVPVFPYSGPKGKRHLLQLLGLERPSGPPTSGQSDRSDAAQRREERDAWIVDQLRQRGRLTIDEVVTELGITGGTATTAFHRLVGRPTGGHEGTPRFPDQVVAQRVDRRTYELVEGADLSRFGTPPQTPQPTAAAPTRGQLQVRSNDLLRNRLDQFFPGDPWGMAQFLYWYAEREEEPEVATDADPLDELADELLVDRRFLDDVIALLEDKGQVILYGPPGTGKTYLARKLAEALVPDPTRRALVQFHPSTSYEDFFEGYRPEATLEGDMTYRLTPGPLASLAERASQAPGKRHVMIIDEINRANLPKVLGELLYLFEYRNEQVRTLYRPDEGFQLPKDLWFIGTMNTADRSIALVDAALRRRFHFVPFFPDHGPMKGLLERWLAATDEPIWVGELVALVNDELAGALGGPHLQLGASHFMKPRLDEDKLRRIWQYNIEPFIEDQFFGDPAQIDRFRFDAVLRQYRSQVEDLGITEPDEVAAEGPGVEAGSESPSSGGGERDEASGGTS